MEPTLPPYTQVRLLPSNDSAWKAKRHLIARARQTLDLSYFILEEDRSTSRLMLDLMAAAERGVRVRLLVDYFTTFKQAPLLRLLGSVPGLQVRRYGVPAPAWLAALQAAGIDSGDFVRGLMTTDRAMVGGALKGNTIFPVAVADELRRLQPEPCEGEVHFPLQVLGTLQGMAGGAAAGAGDGDGDGDGDGLAAAAGREDVVRKVALVIQILRGLKQFLHRNHHKLLLADGSWFVMGGRNLADAYHTAHPAVGHAFEDTDLLAHDRRQGGSPHAATFQTLWTAAQNARIDTPDPLDTRPPRTLADLQQAAGDLATSTPPVRLRAGTALPDMHGTLVDNLPADKGDPSITQAYVDQIQRLVARGAPAVVDIVSAYLFLGDDPSASATLMALRNSLMQAVAAGITINVHTNSLASTDLKPVNRAAYAKLLPLIEAGVHILELDDGQGSLHTKAAAIGDDCLMVGSYNMDPRSELYDTNNLIVLHDPSGAATAAFRRTRVRSLRWKLLTADEVRDLAAAAPVAVTARLTDSVL